MLLMINSGEKNSMQLEFFSKILNKTNNIFNPFQRTTPFLRTTDSVQCEECLGEGAICSHPFPVLILLANFEADKRQRQRQGCPWTNGE